MHVADQVCSAGWARVLAALRPCMPTVHRPVPRTGQDIANFALGLSHRGSDVACADLTGSRNMDIVSAALVLLMHMMLRPALL